MKILVLVKQTPDTEANLKLINNGNELNTADLNFIINPYDEFAIEEALKIKTKLGGDVTIMSLGGDTAKDRIIKALAMGADRGVHIHVPQDHGYDSLVIANILKTAIQKEQADLVLCGKQAIDEDNMHTGIMLAQLLGWPHVNVVTKMEVDHEKVTAHREVEGGQVETYTVTLPAVFGAHKSLNSPRYVSLPGIMKAKRKPFVKLSLTDLDLDAEALGQSSKTKVVNYQYPPKKPQGKCFQGESAEQMVDQVVKLLREEANVI